MRDLKQIVRRAANLQATDWLAQAAGKCIRRKFTIFPYGRTCMHGYSNPLSLLQRGSEPSISYDVFSTAIGKSLVNL